MNAQAPQFLMTAVSSATPTPPTHSQTPTPPLPTPSPPLQTPLVDDSLTQKQPPPPPQVVRILRREPKKPNNNRNALSDNGDSLDPYDQRKNMTIEERELAYGLARARIFAEEAAAEPPRSNSSSPKPAAEKPLGENKLEASPSSSSSSSSASSSTSGPAKTVVSGKPKKKNPSTSTQPNGDAATGRAPRVTHKPKPQFRPPASANFVAASAQIFGYPGFVPAPDAYAEQQQGRPKYATNPSNFYPTSTTFSGRPPPASVMYNQNNQMAYANGNFLLPGVPHAATPFYPMDAHPGPYMSDSQLMSGSVGYSGNGVFYHPMQTQQQSYPSLQQYSNVASANGPPYRPVSGGYDWTSSSLNPNMVISPYGPAPGNSGGMTNMASSGRYDGTGMGQTPSPSMVTSSADPSMSSFFGGTQMHNNHFLNHQDNTTHHNSYQSKQQQQQQRPQLHQHHLRDYSDLQPHHQSQGGASPNLYFSMYPPLPQTQQQARPDLQPTRPVQLGCWGQQLQGVPSSSPGPLTSGYPSNSTIAKQPNTPQLSPYNNNSTNPSPSPSLTGNTQNAGGNHGGNGIGSTRQGPYPSSSSTTSNSFTTSVPNPGVPNDGMSSGYPIPRPTSSSPANVPSSSLPQPPYR